MRFLTALLGAAVALATVASTASAQGLYIGGQLGFGVGGGEDVSFGVDLVLDAGPFVDVFVGTSLGSVRIEGEYAYRQNDMDTWNAFPIPGEMTSHALMGNVYYDFGSASGIRPYVGGGLGFADVTLDSSFYATDDSDTTFAMQLMFGVAFPLSQSTSMTMELRGLAAFPEFTDSSGIPFEQEYAIGSLAFGVRATF